MSNESSVRDFSVPMLMNSRVLTGSAVINAPPSTPLIILHIMGIIGSSTVRFVADSCMFWRSHLVLCLFSYAEARRANYIPGINKYHEKVTFPSVICATSKSNYMENDVRKAVCVFFV